MNVMIISDEGTVCFEVELTKAQCRQVAELANSFATANVNQVYDVIQNFNETCTSLASVLKTTPKRINAIKTAARVYDLTDVFARVQRSPFLTGHNDRGFKATFDWILKPDNLVKIMEGNYDGKPPKNSEPGSFDVNDLERRALDKYRRTENG